MATATATPKNHLFPGEWKRRKARPRVTAAYQKKRARELVQHADTAAHLYSVVLVQRCCVAIGCKTVADLASVPDHDMEAFQASASEFSNMVHDPASTATYFTTAKDDRDLNELIAANEKHLQTGLRALKTERRWLEFVDEKIRDTVAENVQRIMDRLTAEAAADEHNAEARRFYDSLAIESTEKPQA